MSEPGGVSRRVHSIRTELIVYNIMALALLMLVLGVIIRYTVLSTIIASVDRELYGRTRRFDGGPPQGPPPPRSAFDLRPGPPPEQGSEEQQGRPPQPEPPQFHLNRPSDQPREDRQPPNADFGLFSQRRPRFRRIGGDPERRRRRDDEGQYAPRVFDANGKPFDATTAAAKAWDADGLALAEHGKTVYSTVVVDGEPVRVLTRPFPSFGPTMGIVQSPYPLTEVYRAIASLGRALLFLSPLGLIGAGLGGAYLTDRVLRRVRRMTQAAGEISANDFSARLPVMGDDEFSELASTFNGLLSRLEGAFRLQAQLFDQQRRFTADASHELKTPLTVIKGTSSMALSAPPSEALYRQSFAEIDRAANTMSHLVQDLLLLARSDGGQMGRNKIEILLGELLRQAVSRAASAAAANGDACARVVLSIEDESMTVHGNEQELVRLFGNLMDNALRWTTTDGAVTVSARRQGPSEALILVADNGIGIAPEHLAHLGERFYRVDESRARPDGGTGLGLSISRGIVEAHGGTIAFASVVGKGTTVRITLPLGA